MRFPCTQNSPCFDPASPIENLSAELEDRNRFIGQNFGPGPQVPPPLGSNFTKITCLGVCQGDTQEEVDLCAHNAALACAGGGDDWGPPVNPLNPPPNDPPGPQPPTTIPNPPGNPATIYFNSPQTGTASCPDGTQVSYTLAAGSVSALTQGDADSQALSIAQQRAQDRLICMTEIPEQACLGDEYTGAFISAGSILSSSVTDGALPPGLALAANEIVGEPTTAGVYSFTITANSVGGTSLARSFTITVLGFQTTSPLTDAILNEAYLFAIIADGPTEITITHESGELPPGLALNESGNITGTATVEGDYTFTLRATDESGLFCDREFTISAHGCIADNATLPEGNVGVFYSHQLTLEFTPPEGATVVFALTGGALPDGLSMNDSGLIFGTPTTEDTFSFTVQASSDQFVCSKDFTIEVTLEMNCVNWDNLSWPAAYIEQSGGTATFVPQNTTGPAFTAAATCDAGSGTIGFAEQYPGASVVYNGPGCSCNLHAIVDISTFNPADSNCGIYVIITAGATELVHIANESVGTNDFPFNVPDTFGADVTIRVSVSAIANNVFPAAALHASVIGTITNL